MTKRNSGKKLLVYGAGVIGSLFAAKLWLSGQDVTVLARGKRYEEIKEQGIILCNPKTTIKETAKVKVISELKPDMAFDYLFVVMQSTQVDSILENLSKNVSENMVFIVNTASGYEKWIRAIGERRLLTGFPSAGGERLSGTVNYFIGKGLLRGFQTTTFGEPGGKRTQRVEDLLYMFNRAGIPSVHCSNMADWQKTHVAVVTCIANALYGHNCNNKQLAASRSDVKNMILGIKEGFGVLKSLGIKPTPVKLSFFRLPSGILTLAFGLFLKTQLAEITMAKHCMTAKGEMTALQQEFDKLIEKSEKSTPYIDALRKNLEKI